MGITVIGEENMVDVNIIDEAFAQPGDHDEFHWYLNTDHVSYRPYLIKAVGRTGMVLSFRGVDLSDRTVDFGPDSSNNATNYTVDLSEVKYVYREAPSTLKSIQIGDTNCYALLFLSDGFRTDNDPQSRLTAARGGAKMAQELGGLSLPAKPARPGERQIREGSRGAESHALADTAYNTKVHE